MAGGVLSFPALARRRPQATIHEAPIVASKRAMVRGSTRARPPPSASGVRTGTFRSWHMAEGFMTV